METSKPPTKLAQAWAAWNESTKTADDAAGPTDQAGTEAVAAVAVAEDAPTDVAEVTAGDESPAATEANETTGATEATDATTEEPVAITAAKAVGVMEASKPPTKLAQAWAAWNESTKAADEAAAGRAATDPAQAVSYTLTPPATTSTGPATGPGDKTTASSAPLDASTADDSVAVAAGTWKPPVPEAQQSLAGGAMSWLRRDRDRDHGGR